MVGKTILHYKILEKLGEGGMGVVYKAHDAKLKRDVAIKFLTRQIAGSEEERERFKVEAQAAVALNHPNIAIIHNIEEVDDEIFIVMEYIDGKELKDKVDSSPLPINETLDISLQIAKGLQAAHEKGIVHLDIKDTNVMVTKKGQVKITDFGLATLADARMHTETGAIMGTTAYMSPEQIQAFGTDHRTDMWSFGVVLYKMITGVLPFQGDYEAAMIYEILNEEPKAIQLFRSDVPENIIKLVSTLLQKEADNRLNSGKEIIECLSQSNIHETSEFENRTVAVLYFENMSSEKENEYFCAGMTEDLIIDLSKIQDLNVIPRSDVLPFRDNEVNSQKVGENLGVSYIVEGSVRKAGKKIHITAQLVDVQSGFQVWAERYDRFVEDVFDIQMEVAENIAHALKVSLTDSEKQSLKRKPTDDLRAYDFYIRARDFLSRRGKKNNECAIQMFEHALSIDPNFSLACAGLAEAYSYNYAWYVGDEKWLEKTIEMNEKARSLDPKLIETQFGIGMVYYLQNRFSEAMITFKKMIKQKPDFYDAYRWLGITSDVLEDIDAAIQYYKLAAAAKPYSEEPWLHLEMTFRRKGNLKASQEAARKVLELGKRKLEVNPNDGISLSRMAGIVCNYGRQTKSLGCVKESTGHRSRGWTCSI